MKLWDKYEVRETLLGNYHVLESITMDMANDPNRENGLSSFNLNAFTTWIRLKGSKKWLNVKGLDWRKWTTVQEYVDYVTDRLQEYVDAHNELSNELYKLKQK